jgi:uncharacterized protein YdhG (YjbR/CyaY superfamily)
MEKNKGSFATIDEYIATCPKEIQTILEELRAFIRATVPEAEEKISYQMPAFALKGILVYFAAQKNHIGFYPTGSGVAAFEKELTSYAHSKGAIRFPIDKPLPWDLIKKIVEFRVAENQKKAELKSSKRK